MVSFFRIWKYHTFEIQDQKLSTSFVVINFELFFFFNQKSLSKNEFFKKPIQRDSGVCVYIYMQVFIF